MPFYNVDNGPFWLTLFEFMNGGTINFDPDRLAQLTFNPLLCESYKNFSLCKDNDPDVNFYLENSSCEYYTEDSFKNMLAENQSRLNLKCGTLETAWPFVPPNFLGQLRVKFPIIGISETWLDDCYYFSDIVSYNFLHKPRVNHIGGGVGLYIGEHLNYKERHDLAFPEDKSAESLFVEINRIKENNIIVAIIYRPPDSKLNEFLSDSDLVLGNISKENKLVFLMGDWNLNLINHHCHKATSDFLDLLYSRMYFPLITRPTRITANKASLIDNIFTNDPLRPSISGLFLNDVSDHLPIFSLVLGNSKQ